MIDKLPLVPMTIALGSSEMYPAPCPVGLTCDAVEMALELRERVRNPVDKLMPKGLVKLATPLTKL